MQKIRGLIRKNITITENLWEKVELEATKKKQSNSEFIRELVRKFKSNK